MSSNQNNPAITVLTIIVGLITVYIFTDIRVLMYIATGIGIISLISSFVREKIHQIWFFIIKILAQIFPKIILFIIFYVVLTPVAILSKLFTKNDILKLSKNYNSYFNQRSGSFSKIDFEKIW
jgi:hypothetical protein